MRDLMFDAATRAARYLDDLGERAVTSDPATVARLRELERLLPGALTDPAASVEHER